MVDRLFVLEQGDSGDSCFYPFDSRELQRQVECMCIYQQRIGKQTVTMTITQLNLKRRAGTCQKVTHTYSNQQNLSSLRGQHTVVPVSTSGFKSLYDEHEKQQLKAEENNGRRKTDVFVLISVLSITFMFNLLSVNDLVKPSEKHIGRYNSRPAYS